jgi:hypothetical protein
MLQDKNSQQSSNLCNVFVQIANEAISKFPQLNHSWKRNSDNVGCSLTFPKQNEKGFDVMVEVSSSGIIVSTHGAHQHFDSPEDSNDVKTKKALTLVRDLLSSDMRIREFCAGNSAYRWNIEVVQDNQWRLECSTGLLFWNYFGKRSERIFQNFTLPGRLNNKS